MSLTLTKNIFNKYKCNYNTFIETGTYKGGSVELALQCNFDKIYTIDISTQHKIECQYKFQKEIESDQVELLFGDSTDILPNIINKLNNPCLFWLDSHFDLHSDVRGKYDCPILHELDIIKSSNIKTSAVLVIKSTYSWPLAWLFISIAPPASPASLPSKFASPLISMVWLPVLPSSASLYI